MAEPRRCHIRRPTRRSGVGGLRQWASEGFGASVNQEQVHAHRQMRMAVWSSRPVGLCPLVSVAWDVEGQRCGVKTKVFGERLDEGHGLRRTGGWFMACLVGVLLKNGERGSTVSIPKIWPRRAPSPTRWACRSISPSRSTPTSTYHAGGATSRHHRGPRTRGMCGCLNRRNVSRPAAPRRRAPMRQR